MIGLLLTLLNTCNAALVTKYEIDYFTVTVFVGEPDQSATATASSSGIPTVTFSTLSSSTTEVPTSSTTELPTTSSTTAAASSSTTAIATSSTTAIASSSTTTAAASSSTTAIASSSTSTTADAISSTTALPSSSTTTAAATSSTTAAASSSTTTAAASSSTTTAAASSSTTTTAAASSSTTTTSAAPSSTGLTAFEQDIVDYHNKVRAVHDAQPVYWNATLAAFAQNYLNGDNCNFAHSGGPYGENIAMGYPTNDEAMDAWYVENELYNYTAGKFGSSTGHFTQMVWNNTNQVGCAVQDCGSGVGDFLVCEYYPRGNIIGWFVQNVFPPTD